MRILRHPCRRRISRRHRQTMSRSISGNCWRICGRGDWKRSRMARRSQTEGDVMSVCVDECRRKRCCEISGTGSSTERERPPSKRKVGGSNPSRCIFRDSANRTDSSKAEPPAFNRSYAGSSPARCNDVEEPQMNADGRRSEIEKIGPVAQRVEAVGSEPT